MNLLFQNRVYTQRSGLATGFRRRGGFGFLPARRGPTVEQQFLKSLDLDTKTVFDMGAYIGLTTMFLARRVGPQGHVVAFEPNPANFATLNDHLALNHITNVRALCIGLASTAGTQEFAVAGPARGTFEPSRQRREKQVQVMQLAVDTCDHLVEAHRLPAPAFVKMDVEGMELNVLKGMQQTIRSSSPALLIELHGVAELEIVNLLLDVRYKILQIEEGIELGRSNQERAHGHIYAHQG